MNGVADRLHRSGYCPDMLTQVGAAIAAPEENGLLFLRDHGRRFAGC